MSKEILEKDPSINDETLHLGEKTKGDTRSLFYMYALGITLSLGSCNYGYSTGVFNSMQSFMGSKLNWTTQEQLFYESVISSALSAGGILGVVFTWFSADFSGRKFNILLTDIIYVVGTAFTLFATEWAMILGRFIIGFAAGITTIMTPIFLREVSPNEVRGKICGLNEIFIGMGQLFSYIMAVGLPVPDNNDKYSDTSSEWWRIMFAIGFILAIGRILLVYIVFKIESPFYLYIQGNEAESRLQLKKLVKEDRIEDYVDQLKFESQNYKEDTAISIGTLFGKQYRYALFLCMTLVGIQMLSGIDAVIFYCEKFFKGSFSRLISRILEIFFIVVKILTATLSSLIVDRIGRKPLFIIGTSMVAISLFCLFLVTEMELSLYKPVFLYLYIIAFSFSLGPMVWIFVPETMPERGVTISVLMHWTFSFILVFTYPYLIGNVLGSYEDDPKGIANSYLVFMNFCILGIIIVVKYLPETARRSRQSIYRLMHTSSYDMSEYSILVEKEARI